MENNLPLITIITVTYNVEDMLENTILSVINQAYPNIEYIIIDGQSTDKTIEIIRKYEEKISYWISEKDKGIYDAMNKGISKSTGKWINFMNAGDCLYDVQVLNHIFADNRNLKNIDVIFGDTIYKSNTFTYLEKPAQLYTFNKELPFCHQSCFVKSEIMKKYRFDTNYKICADYNFFSILYRKNSSFYYYPSIIAIFSEEDSISRKNGLLIRKENKEINNINSISWEIKFLILTIKVKLGIIYRYFVTKEKMNNIKKKRLLKRERVEWIDFNEDL